MGQTGPGPKNLFVKVRALLSQSYLELILDFMSKGLFLLGLELTKEVSNRVLGWISVMESCFGWDDDKFESLLLRDFSRRLRPLTTRLQLCNYSCLQATKRQENFSDA